jgi:hypothetical protein
VLGLSVCTKANWNYCCRRCCKLYENLMHKNINTTIYFSSENPTLDTILLHQRLKKLKPSIYAK